MASANALAAVVSAALLVAGSDAPAFESDAVSAPPSARTSAQDRNRDVVDLSKDIEPPRVIREVKPAYTRAAMNAGVQGEVWMKVVVQADGTVGRVDVVRSLDDKYGLDEEAVKAARQWRFTPGTKDGEPVNVRVTIEMSFTLKK